MNSLKKITGLSMIIGGMTLTTGALAMESAKGPADAVAICEAVLQDNAQGVAKLLSDYRAPRVYSVATLAPSTATLRDARDVYTCNGMSLNEFAKAVGAEETAALLASKEQSSEDLVADAQTEEAQPQS